MAAAFADRLPLAAVSAFSVIPRAFYERSTVDVARELLGQIILFPPCAGRIVEVEAYLGTDDLAAHASKGLTPRTKALYGPPGHLYIYFIYGMHECLNLVAEPDGTAGGILIRAVEPLCGLSVMQRRRPAARTVTQLCSGPGRLTQAFGITRKLYGADATRGPLTIRQEAAVSPGKIASGPRIGIRQCTDWPLRFWIEGNTYVSH